MGLLDDMQDSGQDMMDSPEARQEIERIAKDRGMTMEEAKQEYLKMRGSDQA